MGSEGGGFRKYGPLLNYLPFIETKFLTKASLGYMETLSQQNIKRKRGRKESRLDLILPVTHRKLLVCYHFTDK